MERIKSNRFSIIGGLAGLLLLVAGSIYYVLNPVIKVYNLIPMLLGLVLVILYAYLQRQEVRTFFLRRSTRYGLNFFLFSLFILGIFTFIGTLSARHNYQIDLTTNKRFSLSDQTKKVLKEFEKDVKITCFFKPNEPGKRTTEDLMKQYADISRRFKYEFIDPDRKLSIARRYRVTSYGTVVFEYGNREERIKTSVHEESVTNALLKVMSKEKKSVYFTGGHGEGNFANKDREGYDLLKKVVEGQNYLVKEFALMNINKVPQDCAVAVIVGPKKEFFTHELEVLDEYLRNNGRILALIDPPVLPVISSNNLEEFFGKYGIDVGKNIVIDKLSRLFGGDYFIPVVTKYPDHAITAGFGLASYFPIVRSVKVRETPPLGVRTYKVVETIPESWAEVDVNAVEKNIISYDAGRDRKGPISIAAAAVINEIEEEKTEARIAVYGDSDFVNNGNINLSGNQDLFLNTINWLIRQEKLISIRPKRSAGQPLFLSARQGRLMFWLPIVFMPSLVILAGTFVFVRRKRR